MRERLFRVIARLEKNGWTHDAALIMLLRELGENSDASLIEEVIEAFRV